MPIWTVHSKVEEPAAIRAAAEDVRFVREGFNWPAFLVPLLWLVIKGMWIVLLVALAVEIAFIAAGKGLELSDSVLTILGLGLNLVMGFAGNDLYRWTLARGGWREIGLAAGGDRDVAEYRFFADLMQAVPVPPAPPTPSLPLPASPMHDALGLFRHPGGIG